MREEIGKVIDTLFSALGVPESKGNRSLQRDLLLGLPVAIGELFAAVPLLYLLGGTHITTRDWCQAAIGLVGAVAISLLSPNWNYLLAGGLLFLAFRSLVALVLGGGLRAVSLGLVFLALAAACAFVLRSKSDR